MHQKKQVILFVSNNYTPYSGGVVSSIDTSLKALRALGHSVYLVTLDFGVATNTDDKYVYRIPCPIQFRYKSNHMAIPWKAQQFLERIVQDLAPDIVHVHHPFLLGQSALIASHTYKIPIVFTYHTLYDQYTHYIPVPTTVARPVVRWVVKQFCRKVNGIIVPSNTIKKILQNTGISTVMETIPSGILPIFVHKNRPHKFYTKPIQLITVSRFAREKNIPFLLRTIKLLDPALFRFTLIGYGSETDYLQQYAYQELKLSPDTVNFVIRPSKEELSHWYMRSHVFIFASLTETQGLVLAEAMAHATPVVALRASGVNDIVVSGVNGYTVDSSAAMADAIKHVVSNQELYQSFSENAWLTAQHYFPEHHAKNLLQFYNKIQLN